MLAYTTGFIALTLCSLFCYQLGRKHGRMDAKAEAIVDFAFARASRSMPPPPP
jgi:hypothetical protein